MLHTWIDSATSGGGCGFLGRDLGGFTHTSVYDKVYERDLVMLNADHGEDDVLTKLMLGPVLTAFHWLWRYAKVCTPECFFVLRGWTKSLTDDCRRLYLSIPRAELDRITEVACISTQMLIFGG